jgi:hypothetical protein
VPEAGGSIRRWLRRLSRCGRDQVFTGAERVAGPRLYC